MSKVIGILFPHQLFRAHEIHELCDEIYMVEEHLFFREFNFHKIKIAFHRASMKAHFEFLVSKNIQVNYIDSFDEKSDIRKLLDYFVQQNISSINFINPTDFWLEKRIHTEAEKLNIQLIEFENPLFINTKEDLKSFFKPDKKSFFQTSFYKEQRLKHNILLDEHREPVGGKWTYDIDNRKKYPAKLTPPKVIFPDKNKLWEEAVAYVNQYFANNLGELSANIAYPFTYEASEIWFDQFLETRFKDFGDFEDSIVSEEAILHHSVLSPMMNVGLILPTEIIRNAIDYAIKKDIPLNSTEGFIRQIIGWREFIRGMYECKGVYSRTKNYWGFTRKIPSSFYDGTTGIEPIDTTIKKVLKTGYCHHIERLMILGNFMLLCEFDPNEVYRWFMELFIDAYDWVMVPNIYGMSQFADGGTFATKPYVSGSNYVLKMSNYKKGDWQETWDGLFWKFMDDHRNFFLKNPRLSMLVYSFDKMDEFKKQNHHKNANDFLDKL